MDLVGMCIFKSAILNFMFVIKRFWLTWRLLIKRYEGTWKWYVISVYKRRFWKTIKCSDVKNYMSILVKRKRQDYVYRNGEKDILYHDMLRFMPIPMHAWGELKTNLQTICHWKLQWNPSEKTRKVSPYLQNLFHFYAPFFTKHIYFTPHDRPPLLKGHHLGWPL